VGEDGVDRLRSVHDDGLLEIVTVEETPLFAAFRRDLDFGEAAALAYAVDADANLVLVDEREARQTARRHEPPMTGVIGILLRGSKEGTVSLRTELNRLREVGF